MAVVVTRLKLAPEVDGQSGRRTRRLCRSATERAAAGASRAPVGRENDNAKRR